MVLLHTTSSVSCDSQITALHKWKTHKSVLMILHFFLHYPNTQRHIHKTQHQQNKTQKTTITNNNNKTNTTTNKQQQKQKHEQWKGPLQIKYIKTVVLSCFTLYVHVVNKTERSKATIQCVRVSVCACMRACACNMSRLNAQTPW